MLLQHFLQQFQESEDFFKLSPHTQRDYNFIIKQLIAEFTNYQLSDLNTDSINCWLININIDNSFTTFNKHLIYVKAILSRALKQRLIAENPCFYIALKRPNRNKGEVHPSKVSRAITRDQLTFLLKRFKEYNYQFYLIMALLAESGCRVGEALNSLKTNLRQNMIYLPITKSGSPRYICFSEPLGKQLTNFAASHPSIYIFPAPLNLCKPMDYSVFHNAFLKMRIGIYVQSTGKLVTIHGIRHTFASERVGIVDPLELKELMGHQSIQTTLRYISVSKQKVLNSYEKTKHLSFV